MLLEYLTTICIFFYINYYLYILGIKVGICASKTRKTDQFNKKFLCKTLYHTLGPVVHNCEVISIMMNLKIS